MTPEERIAALTDGLHRILEEAVESPAHWQVLLDASATLWRYSGGNVALLMMQMAQRGTEEPTLVAGYKEWARHGRTVSRGEHALWVIAPRTARVQQVALPDGTRQRIPARENGNVMSPRITASGMHIVELTESAGSAASTEGMIVNNNFNIRDSHSMNFALNSPGAAQSNTLTAAQVDEARKVVTAFRQMLPILGVPEDSHDEAVQVIADLEEEASAPEPKQNRIKNLLFKSLELIALGTAGGAADALAAMTQSAIDGLG